MLPTSSPTSMNRNVNSCSAFVSNEKLTSQQQQELRQRRTFNTNIGNRITRMKKEKLLNLIVITSPMHEIPPHYPPIHIRTAIDERSFAIKYSRRRFRILYPLDVTQSCFVCANNNNNIFQIVKFLNALHPEGKLISFIIDPILDANRELLRNVPIIVYVYTVHAMPQNGLERLHWLAHIKMIKRQHVLQHVCVAISRDCA